MEEIKLDEFSNIGFLEELASYVDDMAPQFSGLISSLRNGEAVKVSGLQDLIAVLHDEVIKNIDSTGNFSNEKMLRLEDRIAELGSEL